MACDTYFATAVCEFPGCDRPAPVQGAIRGDGFMVLCFEHDAHLFYDPEEFHRMWAEREQLRACGLHLGHHRA